MVIEVFCQSVRLWLGIKIDNFFSETGKTGKTFATSFPLLPSPRCSPPSPPLLYPRPPSQILPSLNASPSVMQNQPFRAKWCTRWTTKKTTLPRLPSWRTGKFSNFFHLIKNKKNLRGAELSICYVGRKNVFACRGNFFWHWFLIHLPSSAAENCFYRFGFFFVLLVGLDKKISSMWRGNLNFFFVAPKSLLPQGLVCMW